MAAIWLHYQQCIANPNCKSVDIRREGLCQYVDSIMCRHLERHLTAWEESMRPFHNNIWMLLWADLLRLCARILKSNQLIQWMVSGYQPKMASNNTHQVAIGVLKGIRVSGDWWVSHPTRAQDILERVHFAELSVTFMHRIFTQNH